MDYEQEERLYSLIDDMRENEEKFSSIDDIPDGIISILEDEMKKKYDSAHSSCYHRRYTSFWGHVVLWSLDQAWFFEGEPKLSQLRDIYYKRNGYEEAILYWGGLFEY